MSETEAAESNDQKNCKPAAKEKDDSRLDWIEIAAAILLALAMVASAWSAYQAARWSGVQTTEYAEANKAMTNSAKAATRAGQEITVDAVMLTEYAIVLTEGNMAAVEAFERRIIRPELQVAIDAWVATDPENNPDAPRSPLYMPEYKNELIEESVALEEQAEEDTKAAKEANQQSDNYVLLMVLFASVLFFAGVSTKFSKRWLGIVVLTLGTVVFIISVVVLTGQPIH